MAGITSLENMNEATREEGVEEKLKEGKRSAANVLEQGKEKIEETLQEGVKTVKSSAEAAKCATRDAVDGVEGVVKKYPIRSVMLGFAVGCVMGHSVVRYLRTSK